MKVVETETVEIEENIPVKRIMISSSSGYDELYLYIFNKNHFQIMVITLEETYDENNKVTKLENNHLEYNYKVIDENIDFNFLNEIYK